MQTSIKWLMQRHVDQNGILTAQDWREAQEIHKQEIINSVLFGMQKGLNINKVHETDNDWVNNYYQNTFKK